MRWRLAVAAAVAAIILRFLFFGRNGDGKALTSVREIADEIRVRVREVKLKNAKKKHDDTAGSDLGDWLDDELGPRK